MKTREQELEWAKKATDLMWLGEGSDYTFVEYLEKITNQLKNLSDNGFTPEEAADWVNAWCRLAIAIHEFRCPCGQPTCAKAIENGFILTMRDLKSFFLAIQPKLAHPALRESLREVRKQVDIMNSLSATVFIRECNLRAIATKKEDRS